MKHLKLHPILESTADAKSILKLIDETESGRDLKAICNLDPKNSGRVYVKPLDRGGSKTYIEKDKATGKYKFAALSNGVPYNVETYDTPEEAFRMLWCYILSKNVSLGFNKKSFRSWAVNPSNGAHGKKLSVADILEVFSEETGNPDMIRSYKGYFAEPVIKKELEKSGIIITPHQKGFWVTYGPNKITENLSKAAGAEGVIEENSNIFIVINSAKPMFKEGNSYNMQWTVGSRVDAVRETEIKILETLKEKMGKSLKNLKDGFWYTTQSRYRIENVNDIKLLSLGMEIGINSISNIIKGKNFSDEFGGLIGLSSEVMSIIRKESPDLLWPEVLKRVDSEMANASSDLGDLGF